MKKVIILAAAAALGLAGCMSVPIPSVDGTVQRSVETSAADFKSDEVLASTGDASRMESVYALAKVVTAASATTRDEAQVLFLADGSKQWVKWTLTSRKAAKADFVVGAPVLYPRGWSGYDTISVEEYRANQWALGRVTSTDELFKDVVEVSGEPYAVKMLRVPLVNVEEE